jgi:hypothetical protein
MKTDTVDIWFEICIGKLGTDDKGKTVVERLDARQEGRVTVLHKYNCSSSIRETQGIFFQALKKACKDAQIEE